MLQWGFQLSQQPFPVFRALMHLNLLPQDQRFLFGKQLVGVFSLGESLHVTALSSIATCNLAGRKGSEVSQGSYANCGQTGTKVQTAGKEEQGKWGKELRLLARRYQQRPFGLVAGVLHEHGSSSCTEAVGAHSYTRIQVAELCALVVKCFKEVEGAKVQSLQASPFDIEEAPRGMFDSRSDLPESCTETFCLGLAELRVQGFDVEFGQEPAGFGQAHPGANALEPG